MLTACGTEYVPRDPSTAVTFTGESIYKNGERYPRDFLGSNLVRLTSDVPDANAYARTAKSKQIQAIVADVLGIAAAIGTIPALLVDDKKANGAAAQVCINLSIAMAVLGPMLHVQSASRELDAVNAYNDAKRTSQPMRPDSRGTFLNPADNAATAMTWTPTRPGLAQLPEILRWSPIHMKPGAP